FVYSFLHLYIQRSIHEYTHTHINTHSHECSYTRVHTHSRILQEDLNLYSHFHSMHSHRHTCTHASTHTPTLLYRLKYTCTCTHILTTLNRKRNADLSFVPP